MAVLFGPVRERVEQLIGVFGVGAQEAAILAGFDALCGEALGSDSREHTPERSRINIDGTPLQFSLSLARQRRAPLQFLAEPGRPGCDSAERLAAGRAAFERLAEICGVVDRAAQARPLLDVLAPFANRELLADSAGVFWFALSCPADRPPSLTIYTNGRWGSMPSRSSRLERFAAFFDSLGVWRSTMRAAPFGLTPLGTAITMSRGQPLSGRAYLSAYGVPMSSYRALFSDLDNAPEAGTAFDAFARHVVGDDLPYPTRSAVFSVAFGCTGCPAPKLELCAHCAFENDVDAADRIARWLHAADLDAELYRSVLRTVTTRYPLRRGEVPTVHAYVGVGSRGPEQYASVYLNPRPALACT